jgi:hexosaminidase
MIHRFPPHAPATALWPQHPVGSSPRLWLRCFAGALAMIVAVGGLLAGDPADTHPGLNLIPWPKVIAVQPGFMKLTAASRIVPADPGLKPLADILADEINLLTGIRPAVADGPDRAGDIVLKLNPALKAGEQILVARPPELLRTTDGAHTLTIGAQAVVEGFDYRAVVEGTATLLQAIRQAGSQVTLPKLAIKDWPHADYCGMMVDCGRQEQPLEWLRKMIETCRMYKVRYLHLHLTDDQGWCFPSTKYPQLGSKNVGTHGGLAPKVYPLEDLKGLIAFADARGIAIVPELEMPGHSGAALRSLPEIFDAINPETKQPVGMGCMNMASEEIYPALDTIIGEMCDVFKSSPYFHIGSDEVSMGRVSLAPGYQAFMENHKLKNDGELANFFIARANDIVKKHGKKTIKWEGMANTAAKDMIIMTWDSRSNMASKLIADGYATITCPWGLEVPWEQWSMYECNCSKLKKGDPVLGATLVAWEQSAEVHTGMVRNVAARQERTWGPDNSATEAGFAARFQAQDAAVGKLIGLPPQLRIEATFTAPAGTCDLLQPGFACDGKDETFYRSAAAPKAGDHFTVELAKPASGYAVTVLTGINGKGLMDGAELQVSTDGSKFATLAKLANGTTRTVLSDHKIKAVRLWCASPQSEAMVVREIGIHLIVAVSGIVAEPGKVLGADNIGVLTGDTTFQWANAACLNPVINKGFTLTFDSGGGNASGYNGPISGTGTVRIFQGGADGGFRDSPMVLGGKEPNPLTGTWQVKCGRLMLAKDAGIDAAGGTIVVGGQGDNDCLYWANNDQLNDAAVVELLDSPKGGATLNLNGCSDRIASLKLAPHTRIVTDDQMTGGVLTVAALAVDGKPLPKGVYTSANPWLTGSGFVVVGDVKFVNAAGIIDNANATIGANNIAVLTAATTFGPATGNCGIPVRLGGFGLTFLAPGDKLTTYSGFITGSGGVTFAASADDQAPSIHALELTGPATSSYQGPTVLTRGILKLNKPEGALAIPGDLLVGGTTGANAGDTVMLAADGQLAPAATVTLNGKAQPCYLDLAGHQTALAKVLVEGRAKIRTGNGGRLKVKQLVVDGKPIAAGTHRAPQPWLEGSGTVMIDPRVDVKGRYGNPGTEIGSGNIGIMTGDTEFWVGVGTCDIDLVTNGHTITFDSGDGNALCYLGSISGTGNVVLLMGPSHTGFKDAPLRLAGPKPNTTTGKFIARKGRVQLEKPDGVDAICGDVAVGGQGFNDCLHWINGNQIKDTATIALLNAGNNGAAFLSLNGCSETVAALTMAANTKVKTDSPDGHSGVLTVKALTVNNVTKPAGTYTSAAGSWIEGNGSIIVAP